jgi:glucosyl-dolichyl phosphate glucuronosyltransferase
MRSPSAAVVVCTASHERAELLLACVDSIAAGGRPPDELFVVVDRNPALAAELTRRLPAKTTVLESSLGGLSHARNAGIAAASADVVAFVDDDVTVDRDWLGSVMEAFARDHAVLGVGGPIEPRWGADRRWLCDELLWVVGCTYGGHRADAGPIRNPIGANMAFRRDRLVALGGFAAGFGKRGKTLGTCEETELSLRLERAEGPGRILFVPGARVRHYVPPTRISWRLLVRRSLSEGLSKGRLRRMYSAPALGTEGDYVRHLLLHAVPALLARGIRRRDPTPLAGAVAVAASLLLTAAAFVAGAAASPTRASSRERER